MFRRRHAIACLVSIPSLALLTAGCEDEDKAIPQAIFEGRLERGVGNDCQDTGELFRVGEWGNPAAEPPQPSRPVKDGEAWQQGVVSVTCTVKPAGPDEFHVEANLDLSGATGGFFRIDGKFKTTGEQTNIRAMFASRRTTNAYDQADRGCIVRYTSQFQGVAAGRVWGEVTCPRAENAGAQKQCEAIADFRFENCNQE
jgi:hypothetical protein